MTEQTIIPLKLHLRQQNDTHYCVWDRRSMKLRGFGRQDRWIAKVDALKVERISDNVWKFMVNENIAKKLDLINEDTA